MYWWNVSKLAEDLREGRVDEKERFKYFLASLIAWNIAVLVFYYAGDPGSIAYLGYAVAGLASAVIGVNYCYSANKKGDNIDFIPRMICLGWPVTVQLAVYISAAFLLYGIAESLTTASSGAWSLFSSILRKALDGWFGFPIVVFIWFYFDNIYKKIALVSRVEGDEDISTIRQSEWPHTGLAIGYLSGIAIVVTIALTGIWVPDLEGPPVPWGLLVACAVSLWTLLIYYIYARLRGYTPKKSGVRA